MGEAVSTSLVWIVDDGSVIRLPAIELSTKLILIKEGKPYRCVSKEETFSSKEELEETLVGWSVRCDTSGLWRCERHRLGVGYHSVRFKDEESALRFCIGKNERILHQDERILETRRGRVAQQKKELEELEKRLR